MKHLKPLLLTLLLLGAAVTSSLAQSATNNYLEIAPFAIEQGTTNKTVALDLINKDQITAFQCDIILPEGIAFEPDARGKLRKPSFVEERTSSDYHTVSFSLVDSETRCYRMIVYSNDKSVILGNSGAVLNLYLVFDEDLPVGTYDIKVKNAVLTKMDVSDEKPAEYICKVTVSNSSETFDSYKSSQKSAADAMLQADDSQNVKNLINKAKNAIDALDFDESKSLAENKAEIDAIINALKKDVDAQRIADKESAEEVAFDEYKSSQKSAAGALAQSGDSQAARKLITDAQSAIDALTYDKSKSLAENKAEVDKVISDLVPALEAQRAADQEQGGTNNYLEIAPFTIQQGTTKKTITLDMINKDKITAFQCDIILPEGFEFEPDSRGGLRKPAFITERTSSDYHTVSFSLVDSETRCYRMIVYSNDKYDILGNSGGVLNLYLVFDEDLAVGTYDIKVNNAVLTKMDNSDGKPAEYICKVTVSNDLATFNSYKSTQKSAADAMLQADDSQDVKNLIDKAKNDIDALNFDESKSLAVNKAKVDAIISTLSTAIADQRAAEQLAADKAAFDEYKSTQKSAAGALAQDGDSQAAQKLIADAQSAIDALTYDESKSLADNKAKADAIVSALAPALESQRAADKLAADKAAFDEYKSTQKSAAGALAQDGDSQAAQKLIADAQSAIDALTYDESKSLADNKAKADAIVSALAPALESQRAADKLAADKAAFDEYKSTQKSAAGALAQSGDSQAVQKLITNAQSAITALTYDEGKSLADNKAKVDTIINTLLTDVEAQRAADKLAADKAAFDEYKSSQKSAAGALAQSGDSQAVQKLITNAQSAITALTYDEGKSLADNKAKVDTIINTLLNDVEAQRAADKLAADKAAFDSYKSTQKSVANSLKQSGDSEKVLKLIENASKAIDALAYNERKTLAQNKAAVDEIINNLKKDVEAQRIADKASAEEAAFIEYQIARKGDADALAKSGDSDKVKQLISDAKNDINDLKYDGSKTLDDNKAKVDAIINTLKSDIEAQRAADKLAADKAAFDEYKSSQASAAEALGQEGDSEAAQKLIADAQSAIDALTYDENKTLAENKAAVDKIISDLAPALESQREADKLAADKAAFDEYKSSQASAAEALGQEGDSEAAQKLIADAQSAIDALTYDESKTLAENKAAVDKIISDLAPALESQREADKLAADKAAFDEYKSSQASAAEALGQEGDSEAAQKLIADAQSAIDALTYDESKSLAENKAAVDKVISDLAPALEAQREADKLAADKAAFDEYKSSQASAAEALGQEGDSEAAQKLIADAQSAIDALTYDESKSLAENKAAVDKVISDLAPAIEAQREADKLAADKAAFDEYKSSQASAAEALGQEGDSEAAQKLIADAQSAIDALTYDESKTLAENKAAVDKIISDLAPALEAQRAADKLAADKAAFDEYKNSRKADAGELAEDGDAQEVLTLIENAQKDIDALNYDESKSLDDNKALVDGIIDQLQKDVENARIDSGIYGVKASNGEAEIYTLDGKKVDTVVESGLYIINGVKKYISLK